jgi:CubicO group peptidase (beta-lactamase class C family)
MSIAGKIAEITSYLASLAPTGEFSGSIIIAQDGIPILQEAYGFADRSLGIPNNIDTKFNLGSLDKMFTAVAIMQLVEKGDMSLQSVVGDYLPDYPVPEIANTVTIHELLTHTSGLGSYFDSPLYIETFDQIRSLEDYFTLFAEFPLQDLPAGQFSYSNSGYIVLGLIIESVSGQSYYDYVRDFIFEPSGMGDTACYELDAGTPNLAVGYTTLDSEGNDTGQINDNRAMLPMRGGSAGGGYSTAPDLLSFSIALLNSQLLTLEYTELVMEGKIQLRDQIQYAYGFFDRIEYGHRDVGHGGGFPGICSIFRMLPDLGYTIVILSNSDGDCISVNDFIIEALLN